MHGGIAGPLAGEVSCCTHLVGSGGMPRPARLTTRSVGECACPSQQPSHGCVNYCVAAQRGMETARGVWADAEWERTCIYGPTFRSWSFTTPPRGLVFQESTRLQRVMTPYFFKSGPVVKWLKKVRGTFFSLATSPYLFHYFFVSFILHEPLPSTPTAPCVRVAPY